MAERAASKPEESLTAGHEGPGCIHRLDHDGSARFVSLERQPHLDHAPIRAQPKPGERVDDRYVIRDRSDPDGLRAHPTHRVRDESEHFLDLSAIQLFGVDQGQRHRRRLSPEQHEERDQQRAPS